MGHGGHWEVICGEDIKMFMALHLGDFVRKGVVGEKAQFLDVGDFRMAARRSQGALGQ